MNILRLTVDKDSPYPVRGTVVVDGEFPIPIRWTYTMTRRHERPGQAVGDVPHYSSVPMLRTNPPRLRKQLSDEDYRKIFQAVSDAAYSAAYTAWENSRAYIPVDIGCQFSMAEDDSRFQSEV